MATLNEFRQQINIDALVSSPCSISGYRYSEEEQAILSENTESPICILAKFRLLKDSVNKMVKDLIEQNTELKGRVAKLELNQSDSDTTAISEKLDSLESDVYSNLEKIGDLECYLDNKVSYDHIGDEIADYLSYSTDLQEIEDKVDEVIEFLSFFR